MNLLEIIYMAGVGVVCLIIGMVIEYFIDAQIIREAQQENQKLKLGMAALQNENKELSKLEIVYPEKNYFKPF